MKWRVEGTQTENPTVESHKYQIRLQRSGLRRGKVELVNTETGHVLAGSFGDVVFTDPVLPLLLTAFQWSEASRFTFPEGRSAAKHYMRPLANLAKRFRGGYRCTFESLLRWR